MIKDGQFSSASSRVHDNATLDSIALSFGDSVFNEVLGIVALHRPELVHVFTHANGNPTLESLKGTFTNRGGYYSALSFPSQQCAILRDRRARAGRARIHSTQGRDLRHQEPEGAIPLHQEGRPLQ